MHCDTVRAALLDFSNGETGPVRAWVLRRHLAACAGCAEELTSLQQFRDTLRRADLVPPEAAPAPLLRRTPPRRALAYAVAALLVGGLLLLPALYQNRRNAQNPGAAIAAALSRVNTWHFSGWKLIDGKQVPWDVWGRRTPWLYYERVGDTITWSDGKQRLRVFAPNLALNRPYGLIVKTSGDQASGDLGFLEDPSYQSLVNSQQARTDFGDGATKLYQQTLTVARFRRQDPTGVSSGVNANKLYVISKRDWLPTTYQRHFDSRTFARDTEYLGVSYDVDLPDGILSLSSPDGYGVVDLTPSAEHINGFRVDVQPASMDKEGNVIITARGWLGKDRLTPGSTFSLDVQPYNGSFFGERRGRTVKYLYATHSSLPPGSDIAMPFAPLEPSEVVHALPDAFLLSMAVTPQILVRSSDEIDAEGNTHPVTRTERLIERHSRWRLPLPKPVARLSYSFPSPYDLAQDRRVYYFSGYDYQYTALKQAAPQLFRAGALNLDGSVGKVSADGITSVNMKDVEAVDAVRERHPAIFKAAERKFRARAAYWQERRLSLPSGVGHDNWGSSHEKRVKERILHAYDLQTLALCYRMAGNDKGQDRALRQLLAYTRSDSSFGVLQRQAEYTLRTGHYPTDADYKGPS